ncbi:MAG TPA: prenyltransferase/squalene oxidase repeat-containing protein [Gemmataceae bacterium]|nr:prenyltransferase/squalene oxidase repeat-containing protein [Gemmataceae bacterium]
MPRYFRGSWAFVLACGILTFSVQAAPPPNDKPKPASKGVRDARQKGLDWLTKNQAADGSWSKGYTLAVSSFACLAYLADSDEPFRGERGKTLLKGLQFLLRQQKDGVFVQQGHTWIHGQGFATLALSEAYGRSLLCQTKPDLDSKTIRAVVVKAVQAIAKNQSESGGWWYTPNSPQLHEGSTTVCAVQALVSARNYRIAGDEKTLDRGFEYLKKCQIADGGFVYKIGDAVSMKEGTAGGVATLGLMQKFDFPVMIKGYKFLLKLTPHGISTERFPYYGHFYGCMSMRLLGQEYKDDKDFREKTAGYIAGVHKELLSWQQRDGAWPLKGWFASGSQETVAYSTAFAALTLSVPEGRLSVSNRTPPKLPKDIDK